jgi:hypothetical protein
VEESCRGWPLVPVARVQSEVNSVPTSTAMSQPSDPPPLTLQPSRTLTHTVEDVIAEGEKVVTRYTVPYAALTGERRTTLALPLGGTESLKASLSAASRMARWWRSGSNTTIRACCTNLGLLPNSRAGPM